MQLQFDGRELELSPQRRQQALTLRNAGPTTTLFKVQCTAPRRLRVRPALGVVAPGDAVSIHVHVSAQECGAVSCKLLVVGRTCTQTEDDQELKTRWAAAEAQREPPTLVFSETVQVQIRDASDAALSDDTTESRPTPKLTTPQIAELVLLLMKSQSRREENMLTSAEREQLQTAKALYASDWPCWEQFASRLRRLLRERNKRKATAT